jgi:hypothetical protein
MLASSILSVIASNVKACLHSHGRQTSSA